MCATVFNLYNVYNNNCLHDILITTICNSAYNLFVRNYSCSLDLYSGDLQTMTVLFTRSATSHKTDWITTIRCLFALALLNAQVISLMKVLEVERFIFSRIITRLNCCLCCIYIIYCCVRLLIQPLLSYTVVGGLLVTSSLHLFVLLV